MHLNLENHPVLVPFSLAILLYLSASRVYSYSIEANRTRWGIIIFLSHLIARTVYWVIGLTTPLFFSPKPDCRFPQCFPRLQFILGFNVSNIILRVSALICNPFPLVQTSRWNLILWEARGTSPLALERPLNLFLLASKSDQRSWDRNFIFKTSHLFWAKSLLSTLDSLVSFLGDSLLKPKMSRSGFAPLLSLKTIRGVFRLLSKFLRFLLLQPIYPSLILRPKRNIPSCLLLYSER